MNQKETKTLSDELKHKDQVVDVGLKVRTGMKTGTEEERCSWVPIGPNFGCMNCFPSGRQWCD